jgi:diguanylate cyclase (GGDEF)-like protein
VIEMVDGDEMVYHVGSGAAEYSVGLRLKASASLSGLCVETGEILYCSDSATDERVDRDACEQVGAVSMVCVPLRHNGDVEGALKVYDPRRDAFGDADLQTLWLLSGVIAAHMSHAAQYQDQAHSSAHDSLTGLPNRRSFDERLVEEAARVRRHDCEVTLCLLDLDSFKEVNDTHGHAAGDEVLAAVARHLGELRGEDVAYRIGGDEFALILMEATEAGARRIAARLTGAIGRDPACRGVGASWGMASMADGDPLDAFDRADEALYEAKRERRLQR